MKRNLNGGGFKKLGIMLYWEAVLFTDERKSDLYEYEK